MAANRTRHHSLCCSLVLRYSWSLRNVEELLEERGLEADHTTVWRWVQRYGPELEKRLRRHLKQQVLACRRDLRSRQGLLVLSVSGYRFSRCDDRFLIVGQARRGCGQTTVS